MGIFRLVTIPARKKAEFEHGTLCTASYIVVDYAQRHISLYIIEKVASKNYCYIPNSIGLL